MQLLVVFGILLLVSFVFMVLLFAIDIKIRGTAGLDERSLLVRLVGQKVQKSETPEEASVEALVGRAQPILVSIADAPAEYAELHQDVYAWVRSTGEPGVVPSRVEQVTKWLRDRPQRGTETFLRELGDLEADDRPESIN